MREFYEKFQQDLERAEREMTDLKRLELPTDEICEKCGKPMVIKWGRHGGSWPARAIPSAPTPAT
jgi:DNA topoisomerase-1